MSCHTHAHILFIMYINHNPHFQHFWQNRLLLVYMSSALQIGSSFLDIHSLQDINLLFLSFFLSWMIKSFVSVFHTKIVNRIPFVHSIIAIMKFWLIYNIPILIRDYESETSKLAPSRMIWWNQATMHEGTRVDSVIAALSADIIYHNLSCGQQSRVMKLEKEIGRREATWCSHCCLFHKNWKAVFFQKIVCI